MSNITQRINNFIEGISQQPPMLRHPEQLEEQLKVYQEKDRAQELLIEKLNRALELLAEELSETRSLDKEDTRKGE